MAENLSHRSLGPAFQAKRMVVLEKPKPEAKRGQGRHQDWESAWERRKKRREVPEGE